MYILQDHGGPYIVGKNGEANRGMGWDGMGWDRIGWDGMGWDGMGWDVCAEQPIVMQTCVIVIHTFMLPFSVASMTSRVKLANGESRRKGQIKKPKAVSS